MPKLSVNLCCYNSEPFLRETLDSVFAQTFQDLELVVVNDGSRDQTDAIVREYLAAGRPIVYHSQANAGLGAARNKALELSSGDFIALIDHDDVWEPEKASRQMALFDRPEVGIVGSDALFIDPRGKPLHRFSDINGMHRGRVLEALFLKNFIPCASAVMRRSAITAAGGFFRPDYRIAEEYELFLRLAGVSEFDFIPEPLVRIRVHRGNSGWDLAREREEVLEICAECLRRRPDLAAALGPRVVRTKGAGFWLSPEEAAVLQGRGGAPGVRVSAFLRYGLSFLGPCAVSRLLRLKRTIPWLEVLLRG